MELECTDINQLKEEILDLKRATAKNIIEIGKRLTQVKANVNHGNWGTWLSKEVQFSQMQANRFMRVAQEFGDYANLTSLLSLGTTKIFSLLDVPDDQRNDFINQEHLLPNGEMKTIGDMTTREVQDVIKQAKEQQSEVLNGDSIDKDIPIGLLIFHPKLANARRNKYDGIGGLAQSIEQQGLFHPLTVSKLGSKYEIICGYRRYYACRMLGMRTIPCVVWEFDEAEREEKILFMSLSENLQRKPLTSEEIESCDSSENMD